MSQFVECRSVLLFMLRECGLQLGKLSCELCGGDFIRGVREFSSFQLLIDLSLVFGLQLKQLSLVVLLAPFNLVLEFGLLLLNSLLALLAGFLFESLQRFAVLLFEQLDLLGRVRCLLSHLVQLRVELSGVLGELLHELQLFCKCGLVLHFHTLQSFFGVGFLLC